MSKNPNSPDIVYPSKKSVNICAICGRFMRPPSAERSASQWATPIGCGMPEALKKSRIWQVGGYLRFSVRCAEGTLLSIAPDFGALI